MVGINKKVCIVAVRVYYCLQVGKWSNQNEKIRINNHCPRGYRVRRVIGGDGAMSNEIDFSKAPEGATHWNGRPKQAAAPCFYKQIDGEWLYWYQDEDTEWIKCNGLPKPVNLFQIPPQWTIHNNDKPLRELSDEQYGKLRRAADTGGVVEFMDLDGDWCPASTATWNCDRAYRIKPKTEREVFVDNAFEYYDGGTPHDDSVIKMIGAIFDAIQRGDIKAPEVVK